jgi:TolB protein
MIGAVTMLAISILVISVVLGIRAGQQQVEVQRRQQVAIALQQALDHQAGGNLEAAFEYYQRVLALDPSNEMAQQGARNLLSLAAAGTPLAAPAATPATAVDAPTATTAAYPQPTTGVDAPPTPATTAPNTPTQIMTATASAAVETYWKTAQTAIQAGRWQEALGQLTSLQRVAPDYRAAEVKDLLFNTYVNLGTEKDNSDHLEEALLLYGRALELRPTAADIIREQQLIELYLEVLTVTDVDWAETITRLEQLYALEPDYRDVRGRLEEAHLAYGDEYVRSEQWCLAASEYAAATAITALPESGQKESAAAAQCDQFGDAPLAADGSVLTGTTTIGEPSATGATAAPTDGPGIGRIIYSSVEAVTGHNQIMVQVVGRNAAPQLLVNDGAQPALRADGQRLVYRNLRSGMGGLTAIDPGTGLILRFTEYPEDSQPTWNALGSRVAFASNREGDRRWRVYSAWADVNGSVDTLGFGEAPAWNPVADQIVFRGCDTAGNNCGLWTMNGSGSNRAPLTSVTDDNRPAWSPDGSFVVFMSSGRDGNYEVYRADVATRQITRLTTSPAVDGLPSVSPDGAWVAFVSNRDGGWKLWAVPSAGGAVSVIAPIAGALGDWPDQGVQWVE